MTVNPTVLNINASMLRHLTTCRRRVWLDRYGDGRDKDAITPNIAFRLGEGIRHEAQVHRSVTPEARPIAVRNWSDGVKTTQTLLQRGAGSIRGAYVEADVILAKKNCGLRGRGLIERLQCRYKYVTDAKLTPVPESPGSRSSQSDSVEYLLLQKPGDNQAR